MDIYVNEGEATAWDGSVEMKVFQGVKVGNY